MEEQILEILKQENKALSIYELNDILGLKSAEELKELLKLLEQMEESCQIYRTKKDRYLLFGNSHLMLGRLMGNKKGFGFVDIPGDQDVYIASSNMNGAIHGDKVVVEIISKKGVDLEGRIVKVVERTNQTIVGEFTLDQGVFKVIPDDKKIHLTIEVTPEHSLSAMPGHKVVVKLLNHGKKENTMEGEVLKIIGHKNDPGVDILSIVNQFHLSYEFSEEVMAQTEAIPNTVLEEEKKDRLDLRDKQIFTIDGDDTKDIDDAISIDLLENGNYRLGVHIADVSHYVVENSPIDESAMERGTSVYLADRVIPMLPHKLSNGICSLNPGEDRLAVSCIMEIDGKGNVVDYEIAESLICSKKQMTYKKVNAILEENVVPEGYEPYADDIRAMGKLASILRKNKNERGYIDFDIDEAKIIVNESGEAIDVVLRERGTGEKLIEDFMIVANETVATHIYFMELPFLYRVHGEPNEEKINSFLKFVSLLGYQVEGKVKDLTPKAMQKILDSLKEKKEFHLLSALLLRSMQKAVYDKTNIGHFGLASKCYTHFTSPIRRYPDTTVHRLLRTYLFRHHIDNDTVRYWDNKLVQIATHSSIKEQDSVACEREVDDMKKAEYMEKHIGEEFDGVISTVMSFGLFVELPNLIDGLVRVDDLKGGFYTFDEELFCLRSDKNKRGYRLGDPLRVRVKAASKLMKTIDFEIVESKSEE